VAGSFRKESAGSRPEVPAGRGGAAFFLEENLYISGGIYPKLAKEHLSHANHAVQ
jgi:hypothetical protein